MINKTKLLNEILENNPELKDKKNSLKDLINILVDNNPDIKADIKFKKQLKDKIDTIISMEDNSIRKLSLFTAFIQVFSLAFVIGGVYFSFTQVDFFDKDNSGNMQIPENIQLEKISPDISSDSIEINNRNIIEDTQILDLFGESDNKNPENTRIMGEPMMMKSTMNIQSNDTDSLPEVGISSFQEEGEMMFDEDVIINEEVNNFEQKLSFEEYCFDNYGEILNIDNTSICIVEGKQCIEDEYVNGVCNFVQIK